MQRLSNTFSKRLESKTSKGPKVLSVYVRITQPVKFVIINYQYKLTSLYFTQLMLIIGICFKPEESKIVFFLLILLTFYW